MLLPTKAIAPDQALLTVGAQILLQIEQPRTVSVVWDRLHDWRRLHAMPSSVPFWWFALALDILYALGAIDMDEDLLIRKQRVT